jgi:para-aminobenzoate synthetase / 4-amino-4-deoxychorismate lyase
MEVARRMSRATLLRMAGDAHHAAMTAPRLDEPMPDPAQGVFSTTLVADGRAVEVDAHLARLETSVAALYGQRLPAGVRELIADGAAGTALGRLRLTVVPGADPTVRVVDVDAAMVFPTAAVELAPVTVPGGIGAHKWADRRLLERAQAELEPAMPLVLDEDGSPLETSRANLFVVRDGAVVTPPADGRLLPGIARARAIEVARAAGIEVRERAIGIDELADADEVFTTGGVRGVEPVGRCMGLAEWDSGEFTARVGAELRRAWLEADVSS